MELKPKHPVHRGDPDSRGRFDVFAERTSYLASSPLFFLFCVLLILACAAGYIFDFGVDYRHILGNALTGVAVLLLALLKNAELRSSYAVQEKLDAIAQALKEKEEDGESVTAEALEDLERAEGIHKEV